MNTFPHPDTALAHAGIEILEARIAPANFHWISNATGNWNVSASWFNETTGQANNGFPNSAIDAAKFVNDAAVTAATITVTIPTGVTITLGSLQFNDDTNYIITDIGSGNLVLDGPGGVVVSSGGTGIFNVGAPVTFADPISLVANGTGGLTFSDSIGETGGAQTLTKSGTGTLRLSGSASNTYTGLTTVQAGTLELQKSGGVGGAVTAIAGPLLIGDGSGTDTVKLLAAGQIASAAAVTISRSGVLDLNGLNESFGALTIEAGAASGGQITTGAGTLTLGSNVTLTVNGTGAAGANITGNLSLGTNARTFTINDGTGTTDELTINGVVSGGTVGGDSLIKTGSGTLVLGGSAANTYVGTVRVNNGTLKLAKTTGVAITDTLIIGDATPGDTVVAASNDNIADTASIQVEDTGVLTFGTFSDSIGLLQLKSGPATGAQVTTTTGTLTLLKNVVVLTNGTGAAGAVIGGQVTLTSGAHGFDIADGTALVDLDVSAVISGPGGISKSSTGTQRLSVANTFTGPVQVIAGSLEIEDIGGLGAAGAGKGTTVASGASLLFDAFARGTLAEDLIVSGTGAAGQPGAIVVRGNASGGADITLTGALRLGADATISGTGGPDERFVLAGPVGAADDALAILTVNSASMAGGFAFAATATFTAGLAGLAPGAGGHDQLKVIGTMNLSGAALNVVLSFSPQTGDTFKIVDNDGTVDVPGTFAGLAEGATVAQGGRKFTISYAGGDGNDVVLTALAPESDLVIAPNFKSATFTDVDGDRVTVKTTLGQFATDGSDFTFGFTADNRQQLQKLTLGTGFTGANVTITAQPTDNGGNGFVNVGFLNATGIDLGAVKIAGDLGRINAGTVGGNAKVPGVKSLTIESLGLLGTSTQAMGGNLASILEGALPKLTVKGDVRNAFVSAKGAADGKLGTVKIGGSVVGSGSGFGVDFVAKAGIGSFTVGGDIRTLDGGIAEVFSDGPVGAVRVRGSIDGESAAASVKLTTSGQFTAPGSGLDLALKSLTVGGSTRNCFVLAGFANATNADASIGSITIGGDWIASTATAGSDVGADGRYGTADDAKLAGGARDNLNIFSSIGSFTVKGQALGTPGAGDMFGIVAERIGKAKVGGRKFAFANGATPEAFFAAPTGPGAGTENPAFDLTIRELGSLTPTIVADGAGLVITGNTATFTDVDGDLVTVKRSAGTFLGADFTFADAGIGAQLQELDISAAPDGKPVNLSITAKPGQLGGNGFVNVGNILATGLNLGSISIAGELTQISAGKSDPARPGVKSLTVHSVGALGTSPGFLTHSMTFQGGIGALTVLGDVRDAVFSAEGAQTGKFGSVVIAGSLSMGASMPQVLAEAGIGSVKIGGSVRTATIDAGVGAIGSIIIGGDLIGTRISAFGQLTAPAKGLDLAIKSLTVKGNIENARIELGIGVNADASLGALSVGRAWLASSVLAGVKAGTDTFVGTGDDTKTTGAGLRDEARFSTIASITIKGQALGSIAGGDTFGIVAEQILKAKIGARTFVFDKGERDAADAFAAAPTGPGATALVSDFFLREIIV